MHPTMEDIARECGVSKMTVSRVLAGRPGASSAMRKKVLSVAKQFNYENNVLAANFAQRRSGFVGVATPFEGLIGSSYLADVFKGFQQIMSDSVWDFALFDILSPTFSDGSKLEKVYRSRKVEGLLLVAPHVDDEFLETLADLDILLVAVGEMASSAKVSCVVCDDAQGIELACNHLLGLGHRRIAFVGGPQHLATARRRQAAYLKYCHGQKLRLPGEFMQAGAYTRESGRQAGLKLLSAKTRPTAVVAANDMMAFGVIDAARELRLAVPQDLSVVGFDDLSSTGERYPLITTVHQPVVEMAARAAGLLVSAMETGHKPDQRIMLPVHLVRRATTTHPSA